MGGLIRSEQAEKTSALITRSLFALRISTGVLYFKMEIMKRTTTVATSCHCQNTVQCPIMQSHHKWLSNLNLRIYRVQAAPLSVSEFSLWRPHSKRGHAWKTRVFLAFDNNPTPCLRWFTISMRQSTHFFISSWKRLLFQHQILHR